MNTVHVISIEWFKLDKNSVFYEKYPEEYVPTQRWVGLSWIKIIHFIKKVLHTYIYVKLSKASHWLSSLHIFVVIEMYQINFASPSIKNNVMYVTIKYG